jgi:hypothetical protein
MTESVVLMVTAKQLSFNQDTFLNDLASKLFLGVNKDSIFAPFRESFTSLTAAVAVISRLAVEPEQTIYVYYTSFNDVTEDAVKFKIASRARLIPHVKAINECVFDPQNITLNPTLKPVLQPVLNLLPSIYVAKTVVPDMPKLQTSRNYIRNAILMWLELEVMEYYMDASNIKKTQNSKSFGFPVVLPDPHVGKHGIQNVMEGGKTTDIIKVTIGIEDSTNNLGKEAGAGQDAEYGQARWYSLEVWEKNHYGDLAKINFTAVNQAVDTTKNRSIALPDVVTNVTKAVRQAGERLKVTYWSDNQVIFENRKEPGFVILWRDDIPSRAIDFLEQFTDDMLETLANKIWFWSSLGGKEITNTLEAPACEAIRLGVTQVSDSLNNWLYKNLPNNIDVRFGFILGKPAGSSFDVNQDVSNDPALGVTQDDLSTYDRKRLSSLALGMNYHSIKALDFNGNLLADKTPTKPSEIYIRPDIVPETGTSPVPVRSFQIQMTAQIKLMSNAPVIVRIGPLFTFIPNPLEIPTVAVFFQREEFQGVPLVLLPSSTPWLATAKWDVNSTDLAVIRDKVCSKLSKVKTALDIISIIDKSDSLQLIRKVIGCIDAYACTVIDGTGYIENLNNAVIGWQWWDIAHVFPNTFNDSNGSVILVGPPHSLNNITVKCYEHEKQTGHEMTLLIPDKCLFTAIHDFRKIFDPYKFDVIRNGNQVIISVPLPYESGYSPGFTDFHGLMSSVTIG